MAAAGAELSRLKNKPRKWLRGQCVGRPEHQLLLCPGQRAWDGSGPSLQLPEPKGDTETWHSSEHSSLSLGMVCPQASKGIGVTG